MDLGFTDEQSMLQDMIRRFLRDEYGFDVRRKRLKAGAGHDATMWNDLANTLGILGATVPEDLGGLGGGAVETMIVMEALGEALVTEPYLETAVLGAALLRQAASDSAHALIARIPGGSLRLAYAAGEPTGRYTRHDVRTTAIRDGDGWRIDGEKSVVAWAPAADRLIVTARTHGNPRDRDGISLFLVDPGATGVVRHDYRLIDDRPASDLTMTGVRVGGDALLGPEGGALPLIERAMDEAIAALCAEAVGVMRRMLADTIAYTRDRRQFGQPLSRFQVLQHRMVDMYMAVEQAVSATYLVTLKLDAGPVERTRAVSAAKATIGETIRFVAQNAVQLHGAMGMTEELAVGHFFRRATVIEQQFGSVDHHLKRYWDARELAA